MRVHSRKITDTHTYTHSKRHQQEEQVSDSGGNEEQFREQAVSVSSYRLIWKKAETKIETSETGSFYYT